jgi:hypothetical protein
MQAIDLLVNGTTKITLTEYIIVFGAANLIIAQFPHFHSIRFINQSSTICTLSFSLIAVVMSIYAGRSPQQFQQWHFQAGAWGLFIISPCYLHCNLVLWFPVNFLVRSFLCAGALRSKLVPVQLAMSLGTFCGCHVHPGRFLERLLCTGYTQDTKPDYTVVGDPIDKLFGIFNGLGVPQVSPNQDTTSHNLGHWAVFCLAPAASALQKYQRFL